jgi:alanyl-tRNA synthetase
MTPEQAELITKRISELIAADLEVFAETAPLAPARAINGLRAVFGEHYPDPVRVVSIGQPVDRLLAAPSNHEWRALSIEFCGGTHVAKTGEIVAFELTAEEAVAKGVRRVIALTGGLAAEARAAANDLASRLNALAQIADDDLPLRLTECIAQIEDTALPYADRARLRARIEELQERVKSIHKQEQRASAQSIVEQARAIADESPHHAPVIVAELIGANADSLRSGMDVMRSKHPEAAILLITADHDEGKVAMVASVPKSAIEKGLKAGDWVREVAQVCGGGGGGRPDMAQAGGKNPSKINDAIATAREFAQDALAQ